MFSGFDGGILDICMPVGIATLTFVIWPKTDPAKLGEPGLNDHMLRALIDRPTFELGCP
jgi:hypothetical protein